MDSRPYDPQRDRDAALRIWRETGWLEAGKEEAMDASIAAGRALVADVEGEAESLVLTVPGAIRYLQEELPFSCVTSVATSRVARKQGLARGLTAQAVAADAAEGALVCGLGMFDQGYYDRLGFGTGSYEHRVGFDPSQLKINTTARVPRRLTSDDWAAVHASRLARSRGHGSCNLSAAEGTRAEMLSAQNGFGLGYYDGPDGELTHHFWCSSVRGEHGPYDIGWMAFRNSDQFLELMALIKSWGDQVRLVRMGEPPGIQLQDLIDRPFRQLQVSEKSRFESHTRALAYWQMRICDLSACLERTHLRGGEARVNLKVADPIEAYLDSSTPWRGVGGDYVVTLGPSSGAEASTNDALPTLTASVGAFTRLWLGVRPASGLAITDDLAGPAGLLEELDWVLSLPQPRPDWDF